MNKRNDKFPRQHSKIKQQNRITRVKQNKKQTLQEPNNKLM